MQRRRNRKSETERQKERKRIKETLETLVLPVEKMAKDGKLKPLRNAAKECLADDRIRAWRGQELEEAMEDAEEEEDSEAEWGGFAD
jgi:ribosomal RNA-processing protein 1